MTAEELGRRMAAARAYAGVTQTEMGKHLQLSTSTLRRIESGEQRATLDLCKVVAERCGLPLAFFEVDLSRLTELSAPAVTVKVTELEAALNALTAQVQLIAQGRQPR